MTIEELEKPEDIQKKALLFSMNRHDASYRINFADNAAAMQSKCPIAWNDTHGGYWYVAGNQELFDVARRSDVLSNDDDPAGERNGYRGITIPSAPDHLRSPNASGFLGMDPPRQQHFRKALNPYLSPAAIARWKPIAEDLTRAVMNEFIEKGEVDFVEDFINVVPAVLTMGLLGFPLADWEIYNEVTHASVYTPPDSPDRERILTLVRQMADRSLTLIKEIKETHEPGLVDALINTDLDGRQPDDSELRGCVGLLIGGGFDTTTALTAHSLEWLSQHPAQRQRLIDEFETLLDSATEEFLRIVTPAAGDGRTISADVEIDGVQFKEGDRVWLSWAMANRDPKVFENPNEVVLDRTGNRHATFGLGIHRCIGSNLARMMFKTMLKEVLERCPDFVVDDTRSVHYPTTGVINGMQHLYATFTPGEKVGPGLAETMERLQVVIREQRLAEPVTRNAATAELG